MTLDQFAALLATRLRSRYDLAGGVFTLDLRAKPFGNRAPLVVREHTDAGWPVRGTPLAAPPRDDVKAFAAAQKAAEQYVRRHYAPYLHSLLHGGSPERGASRWTTVADASEAYIEAAPALLGATNNTVKNRRSLLRAHAIPAFGSKPLASLTAAEVEAWLKNLTVRKPAGRRRRTSRPAALGTKRYIHRALVAVWAHTFEKEPCPFRDLDIEDGSQRTTVRAAIEAGSKAVLLKDSTGALAADDVQRALVAAMSYDRKLESDPRWRGIAVPNTAPLIATQVATGARIGELALLRWWMIWEDLGVMLIPGTKNEGSLRIVPIQDVLRPWIARLKRLACPDGGAPDEDAFVFRTSRRRSATDRPNTRKLQEKVSHSLQLAGLKIPNELMDGKSTHWARATHVSWGGFATRYIEPQWLSMYVGHSNPLLVPFAKGGAFGGMTLQYIKVMASEMPKRHRQYIRQLPPPATVEKGLATFTPVPLPWRERCTERKPRTPEQAAKQQSRLEQLRKSHRANRSH